MKKIIFFVFLLSSYFLSVAQITVNIPQQILDCNTPSVVLTASTPSSQVLYFWYYPGATTAHQGPTFTVNTNTSSPTSTLIANYTLSVTHFTLPLNLTTTTVIPMYQSLFVPKAVVAKSANAVSCKTPSVILTNQSSSTIPSMIFFPVGQPVVGFEWHGPTPQPSVSMNGTYTAFTPGSYTLIVKDLNNGCMSSTNITVFDDREYPIVNNPVAPGPFDLCGQSSATISPIITSPITNLSYSWTTPADAIISGGTPSTLIVKTAGIYTITVRDMISGCATTATLEVVNCVGLNDETKSSVFEIYPNPAHDLLHIGHAENVSATIYNITGEIVKVIPLVENEQIDLSDLHSGIYYLELKTKEQTTHVKIMKQ